MTNLHSLSDIASILGYFVPGFIALSVRSQFLTGTFPTQSNDRFVTYATISVIYNVLVFRFIDSGWLMNSTLGFVSVFVVGPALIGFLLGINIQKNLIRGFLSRFKILTVHAIPTAWDWKFGSAVDDQWVIVTLKNNDIITGLFGRESFASSNPEQRDLFIQWIYDMNEEEDNSSTNEQGVLIAADEISTIEFLSFDSKEKTNEE